MRSHNTLLLPILLVLISGCTRILDSPEETEENWNRYKSEHFQFYVTPGGTAEADIAQIKSEQERAYAELNRRMDTSFERTVRVYIYENNNLFDSRERTGTAHPEIGTIEAVYGDKVKSIGVRGVSLHELSHIVSFYEWCPSPEPMVAEGLAVWLDDYWSASSVASSDLHRIGKTRLNADQLPRIDQMMTQWSQLDSDISYPTAGSLAKYLIEEYGLERFRELHCEVRPGNYRSIFFEIYEKDVETIEREYLNFLRAY
ncbi:MAG: hypothetical protein R3281_04670 [Balneolaceae bacterium]|nr:hypothetical protein [Balneolaceae bacterium]